MLLEEELGLVSIGFHVALHVVIAARLMALLILVCLSLFVLIGLHLTA